MNRILEMNLFLKIIGDAAQKNPKILDTINWKEVKKEQILIVKEAALQAKVMKYLKAQGFYVRKLHDTYTSGLPDIFCIIPGKGLACFFELKAEKGRLSKIQEHEGKMIHKAGGAFFVCRSLQEVKDCLRSVL